jgi:DNA anti-recombination protein RmuC
MGVEMSQTYRVRVKQAISETVEVDERWRSKVETLPILEKTQMADLVAAALKDLGWVQEDSMLTKSDGIWESTFNPDAMQIETVASHNETVEASFDGYVNQYNYLDDEEQAQVNASQNKKEDLQEEINRQKNKIRYELQQQIDSELNEYFNEIEKDLDKAVESAHKQALKNKAKSLGDVYAVEENEQTGELTIRVKV